MRRKTLSVRLEPDAALRVQKAAELARQSQGAFLEKAGDEAARRLLISWAVERYRQGAASFSELAAETGLVVEEIMSAAGDQDSEGALHMFLASSEAVARSTGNLEFLRLAREAVEEITAGTR